ncbi:MAG: PIN domain-containing protein [Candidatus Aegiribacteria sp.]|nr:PIN domain-containing protein [Candidatus Aegiribacteria sp.]
MQVLVDSSVWIDYFRGGGNSDKLDFLIDENILVINDLILAELIPFLRIKNQYNLIDLLNFVERLDLKIDWEQIIDFQHKCLRRGINGIGIPDLIIAQNALQNHCKIYSLDQHFELIKIPLELALTEK